MARLQEFRGVWTGSSCKPLLFSGARAGPKWIDGRAQAIAQHREGTCQPGFDPWHPVGSPKYCQE